MIPATGLTFNCEWDIVRLAAGHITIDEYRQLLAEIGDEITDKDNPHESISREGLPTGALIAEFEDLRLFEHVIVYKNIAHPLSDVTNVQGNQTARSLNFVPTERWSYFSIQFLSGEIISIFEHRVLFGGKRHEAIGRLLATLRRITFKQRINNLTRKLIQHGQIALTKASPTGDREISEVVILTKDGMVSTPTKAVNLKIAKASGTFGLGTDWSLPGFYSHRTSPYEVVLSEKKAMLSGGVPSGALTFIPSMEDVDIAHALLAWLAEPRNRLA